MKNQWITATAKGGDPARAGKAIHINLATAIEMLWDEQRQLTKIVFPEGENDRVVAERPEDLRAQLNDKP